MEIYLVSGTYNLVSPRSPWQTLGTDSFVCVSFAVLQTCGGNLRNYSAPFSVIVQSLWAFAAHSVLYITLKVVSGRCQDLAQLYLPQLASVLPGPKHFLCDAQDITLPVLPSYCTQLYLPSQLPDPGLNQHRGATNSMFQLPTVSDYTLRLPTYCHTFMLDL